MFNTFDREKDKELHNLLALIRSKAIDRTNEICKKGITTIDRYQIDSTKISGIKNVPNITSVLYLYIAYKVYYHPQDISEVKKEILEGLDEELETVLQEIKHLSIHAKEETTDWLPKYFMGPLLENYSSPSKYFWVSIYIPIEEV